MARTKSAAQTAQEALECLTLYNQGQSERQIVETLTAAGRPLSQPTVHRRIQLALETYVVPELDTQRKMALARLDSLYEKLSSGITQGDTKAIEVALKIETRRAAITGLDKPRETATKVEHVAPQLTGMIEQVRQQKALEQKPNEIALMNAGDSQSVIEAELVD